MGPTEPLFPSAVAPSRNQPRNQPQQQRRNQPREQAGTAEAAIRISDLHFSYGAAPVLDQVNLTVGNGDFLALIGPNGGGKTTLLRLLLGLLRPDRGTVRIFGRDPLAVGGSIGYVPQFSTMQTDFPATVLDMTLMGSAVPNARGGSWDTSRKARDKAAAYLGLLGLAGLEDNRVAALSGGQRQRALVARALMGCPARLDTLSPAQDPLPYLLLLDEPTASIDPEGKFCFYEFLGRLREKITIIVVSHDLFMVSPFFRSVALVNGTVTPLENKSLSVESLTALYGAHVHDCPVADMQYMQGLEQLARDIGPVFHPHPLDTDRAGPSIPPHGRDRSVPSRANPDPER